MAAAESAGPLKATGGAGHRQAHLGGQRVPFLGLVEALGQRAVALFRQDTVARGFFPLIRR